MTTGFALKAALSRPLGDFDAALHRRPRQRAVEPGGNPLQRIEVDQRARAVEADEVAHPSEQRNVGDGEFVAHDPGLAVEPCLENAEKTLRLVAEPLQRALVLDLLARDFEEIAELAGDRPRE